MADDIVKTPTIEERIAELRPLLAAAVNEKWAVLGIATGTRPQDHREVVASAAFDIDASDAACLAVASEFVDKVKDLCQGKKVIALDAPASDVHNAGLNRIGAYAHVLIGFLAA